MEQEHDYPAIIATLQGRSRRLVRKQWEAAIVNGDIVRDMRIDVEFSPYSRRTMIAAEFEPLWFVRNGRTPVEDPALGAEPETKAAVPASPDPLAAPGAERIAALGVKLRQLAALLAETQAEWDALACPGPSEAGCGEPVESPSAPRTPEPDVSEAPRGRADRSATGASVIPLADRRPSPPTAEDLATLYNEARNPDEFARLRALWHVQSFTNDRTGDIAQLLESDVDRFWLVEGGDDPDRALLMPGAMAKRNWLKMRTVTADHPFAHHFTLLQGDRLSVVEPARLRRIDGVWTLERKGTLSGTL